MCVCALLSFKLKRESPTYSACLPALSLLFCVFVCLFGLFVVGYQSIVVRYAEEQDGDKISDSVSRSALTADAYIAFFLSGHF